MSSLDDTPIDTTSEHTETIGKPNPNIVLLITGGTVKICEDSPDENEEDVLFSVTTSIVSKLLSFKQMDALVGVVFSYYLEAFRILALAKSGELEDDTKPLNADHKLTLYTTAALSLFDIYLRMPQVAVARRMVGLAASSLYQVVTAHQATTEDTPIHEVMSDLSDLAILSQTAKEYIKGRRRVSNYPYIKRLKDVLEQATSSHDLSFMHKSLDLKDIVEQVKSHKKTITVA